MKRVRDENSFTSPIAVMINSDDDTESPLVTDTRLMTPSTTRDDSLLYTSSGGSGGQNDGSGGQNQDRREGGRTTRGAPEGHVQTLQIGHYAVPAALRYSNNNRTSSSTAPRGIRSAKDLLLSNRGSMGNNNGNERGRNDESLPLASPSPILSPSSLLKVERDRRDERRESPNPTHSRSTNTSVVFAN